MGAVRDMTESHLVEEELRRAHDHLAEAQRLSKTGSFTSDLLKDEHIWSDEFYRICEFEPDRASRSRSCATSCIPKTCPPSKVPWRARSRAPIPSSCSAS